MLNYLCDWGLFYPLLMHFTPAIRFGLVNFTPFVILFIIKHVFTIIFWRGGIVHRDGKGNGRGKITLKY